MTKIKNLINNLKNKFSKTFASLRNKKFIQNWRDDFSERCDNMTVEEQKAELANLEKATAVFDVKHKDTVKKETIVKLVFFGVFMILCMIFEQVGNFRKNSFSLLVNQMKGALAL